MYKLLQGFCKYAFYMFFVRLYTDLMLQLHCCGPFNYTEWKDTAWHKTHQNMSYPASCCVGQQCDYALPPVNDTRLYQQVNTVNI